MVHLLLCNVCAESHVARTVHDFSQGRPWLLDPLPCLHTEHMRKMCIIVYMQLERETILRPFHPLKNNPISPRQQPQCLPGRLETRSEAHDGSPDSEPMVLYRWGSDARGYESIGYVKGAGGDEMIWSLFLQKAGFWGSMMYCLG